MSAVPGENPTADPPASAPRSMARQAARGLSWSLLGAVGQALLQIIAIAVLSRLVTVEEFGIASAATVVMGLAVTLSQLGVSAALVQARQLDSDDVASVFTLGWALGLVLAGVLFLLAPFISPVVGLPAGSPYLKMLSIVLVFGSLGAVAAGLLQRQLRFRELAFVTLGSYSVGYLGTSVAFAYAGAGAAALIWGQIVQAFLTAALSYAFVRHDVRPRRPAVLISSGRRLFGFGSAYSLSQVGNWVANNGDNLVTTSLLGPAALGIYTRAYQLLVQPANLIGSVADKVLFPAMARIQDDHGRLARVFVLTNSLVAVITLPVSVLLFILAPEVVGVLLGPGWSKVIVPLQIFSVVLLPRTAYKVSGSLTRATGAVLGGAARQWVYAGEVVLGAGVGSRWGINGVAVGAAAAIVLHAATMLKFSGRLQHGLVLQVLRVYAKSLLPAAGVAITCWPLASWLRDSTPALVTAFLTGAAGMGAGLLFLWFGRRLFREEFALLRRARRGKSSSPANPSVGNESAADV